MMTAVRPTVRFHNRPLGRDANGTISAMRMRITLGALVLAAAAAAAAIVATRHGAAAAKITGTRVDRPVPAVPLLDPRGRHVTLEDFRGKVVVLSPVLTLCHEICPLTTAALLTMERTVRRADLGRRVVFAEVSVDPWRDSPARLRAYRRLTGIDLTLLTGSKPDLRRFWRFLGVAFFRTPERKPVDIDWWTHRPQRFDVAHSDGLFFLDRRGRLRIVLLGMPNDHGSVAARLRRMLNDQGVENLKHPQVAWTVPQALDDLSVLLGRRLAASN
jgi:cytochrome oxidase Cu insertion factor (SCO1/SenC/PrrC family)